MEDDDVIAQFTGITSCAPERAQQYLTLADGDLQAGLQLYFENDGADLGASLPDSTYHPPAARQPPSAQPTLEPINADSDEGSEGGIPVSNAQQASVEDDEAMARRMQEEIYGGGREPGGAGRGMDIDPETGVRAPMARTAETLADPIMPSTFHDPEELDAAVREQLLARQRRRDATQRPGIFNQQAPPSSSIWEQGHENDDPEAQRQDLARATGGASENSAKSNRLAELFRPPFELMSTLKSWDGVRADGKEKEKWILVNVQDPNIFDCQVLNRDIWKHPQVHETVKENFIFKQFTKSDPQAANYIRYYFKNADSQDAYPHIAIVDPRTGEQVKVWSGVPAPKSAAFLEQLHEFLDRYSLKANKRNPVATRKADKKSLDVDKMTEEQMLEMAMQNSLQEGGRSGSLKEEDPDILTRDAGLQQQQQQETSHANGSENGAGVSPFAQISSQSPHEEPASDAPNTTRIQFRHPGGRIIRRFALEDQVRRLYEWLKASPLEGKDGQPFELIFMGKNLIDLLDMNIEQAGLKNGSVMVELGGD